MSDPIISECINPTCPFSGQPVEAGSLTTYRGHTVGFCNGDCRDKFAADPDAYPDAMALFDERIENLEKETRADRDDDDEDDDDNED